MASTQKVSFIEMDKFPYKECDNSFQDDLACPSLFVTNIRFRINLFRELDMSQRHELDYNYYRRGINFDKN